MEEELTKKIVYGSQVGLHFRITLDNGFIAEDTFSDEPLIFKSGDGSLIPVLDEFLLGLKPGDEGQLIVLPEQGFGSRDEANIHKMHRSEFAENQVISKGQIIGFTSPAGDEVPGAVLDVTEDQLTIDFNHPFAGHTVTFDVKILMVS